MGEMFAVCLHIITFSQHNLFWFITLNVTRWTSDSWHSGWRMMVRFPRIVLLCRSVNVATCYDQDIGTRLVPMLGSTLTPSGMATSCKRLPAVAKWNCCQLAEMLWLLSLLATSNRIRTLRVSGFGGGCELVIVRFLSLRSGP